MDELHRKHDRDVPMDNGSTGTPHRESDSSHPDPPPRQASGSHNHSSHQSELEDHTRPVEGSSSQLTSPANGGAGSFEAMLEELRFEVPVFHPFSSGTEVPDWLKDTSPNEEFLSTENTDGHEPQDYFSDSVEQPDSTSKESPERREADLTQPSETTLKPGASTDSETPVELLEESSNPPQNASSEDPLAFGSLSLPIADQYPCFQASSSGDRIEIDESVSTAFRDGKNDSMDCNIVTVGMFLDEEALPKLKQENMPTADPEHIIENPLSVSDMYRSLTSIIAKESQEHGYIQKEGAYLNNLDSKDRVSASVDVKLSGSTSGQGTPNVKNMFKSDSAENCITPMTAQPPTPTSVPLDVTEPEPENNLHGKLTTSQDGILDPEGLALSQVEGISKKAFDLGLNSQIPAGEVILPSGYSLDDIISGMESNSQEEKVNTDKPAAQEISETHSQGTNHEGSIQRHCPRVENASSFRVQARMNLALPIPSLGNSNTTSKGHPLVTPTSIISPQVPHQFQSTQRQVLSKEFSKRVKNVPFGVQQMNVRANPWGKKTVDLKRKICEVGSSYQASAKKSRTVSSIPKSLQASGKRTEDTSHLSRLAIHQSTNRSPNLSSSTQPITNTSKSPSLYDLTQNFVPGLQFSPVEGQAQSTQGQASEATVSSPSIPRSTNVRDEGGQHLKRFICSECPAAYAFKENCERHFKVVHQGRTVYFCNHCSASYLQAKTMRCHVDKKHHVLDGANSIFPCYWCGFKTNTEANWSMHVSEMHPGHKNSFRGNSG